MNRYGLRTDHGCVKRSRLYFMCGICHRGGENLDIEILSTIEQHLRTHILNGDPFLIEFNAAAGRVEIRERKEDLSE